MSFLSSLDSKCSWQPHFLIRLVGILEVTLRQGWGLDPLLAKHLHCFYLFNSQVNVYAMKNSGERELLGSTRKGGKKRVGWADPDGTLDNRANGEPGGRREPEKAKDQGKQASGVSFGKKSNLRDRLRLLAQQA